MEGALEQPVFQVIEPAIQISTKAKNTKAVRATFAAEVKQSESTTDAFMRIIALMQYVAKTNRGKAVIFTSEHSKAKSGHPDWEFSVEALQSLETPQEPSDFDGLRQYLLTLLGGDLFGFHPRYDDNLSLIHI